MHCCIALFVPKTWDLHASQVGKEHQCKTSGQHVSPSGPPWQKHQNTHNRRTRVCAWEHPFSPWGQTEESLWVAAVYQAELCFPSASRTVLQLSSGKPQVLLVLISPRAWLCWYLPKIHLEVLTAILVALGEAPGEVTMCWREASGAPTAIFSPGSEEDHCPYVHLSASLSICLPKSSPPPHAQ